MGIRPVNQGKGMHPKYSRISDKIIKSTMENGIAVRPYTVNKDADLHRFFNIRCSAIITDEPVKALNIRKQYTQG